MRAEGKEWGHSCPQFHPSWEDDEAKSVVTPYAAAALFPHPGGLSVHPRALKALLVALNANSRPHFLKNFALYHKNHALFIKKITLYVHFNVFF